jgi:hypothetical protein
LKARTVWPKPGLAEGDSLAEGKEQQTRYPVDPNATIVTAFKAACLPPEIPRSTARRNAACFARPDHRGHTVSTRPAGDIESFAVILEIVGLLPHVSWTRAEVFFHMTTPRAERGKSAPMGLLVR